MLAYDFILYKCLLLFLLQNYFLSAIWSRPSQEAKTPRQDILRLIGLDQFKLEAFSIEVH